MTQTSAMQVSEQAADKKAIRPFDGNVPEAELTELRKRIKATKWPERETIADTSQGVQLATMQSLARYWATDYDWRKAEAKLNSYPQFITEIDGLDIHFIHVRSKHKNALPVIITHGWPGSIIEQLKIIGPLTDPTAFGGRAEDAFDVVIPSLPGYGFSGKPTAPGWTPVRIARAWVELMKRLGYTHYVAQGGDWGNAVSELMALQEPPGLLGIHTNMAATVPANISKALAFNEAPPADLTAEERNAWNQLDSFYKKGLGYALEMNNRPQTLYGIADSPVGLAAWMLDHDIRSYELIARVFDGKTEGLTRDDILDNVTLYWVTNTAISSARLYWDTAQVAKGGFFDVRGVKLPVAVSAFPDEIYAAPRSWAEKAYPKLIHYNKLPKGGHFAAWEQPELFAGEMRAAFKSLRTAHSRMTPMEKIMTQDTPVQTTLYLLEDLDDASKTKQLAKSDLAALHTVADWMKSFVVRPHKDLGRDGAVCPFVPESLEKKTLWLAPEHIADRSVPDVVRLINGYKTQFLHAQPIDGDGANSKVIVVVFTDLPADRAPGVFGDVLQQIAVPSYAKDGILFGPFYEGNKGTAIYNSGFRPFQSPVPFLFVRYGVISDWKFFLDNDEWLNLWARRYGESAVRTLAEELRRLPWRDATKGE